ncbi:DUF6377 domain-containing protein [Dysgonomonas massiliensis]|uniref:DUF6377 domain-containing protein n=1 Tax=Dysgonomonas massiliensis TaxID=2040292 RepID=UPI000C76FD3C|nr:DUF6377 domain-containing protein [Dysgonomonas massiliensis]
MNRILIFIILSFLSIASIANTFDLDSAFKVLDQAIAHRNIYEAKKLDKILEIKNQIPYILDDASKITRYDQLTQEYKGYQLDSALIYARKKFNLSNKLNDQKLIQYSLMNESEILSMMGMYNEALGILSNIDSKTLDKDLLPYYYHISHSTYLYLADYAVEQDEKDKYNKLVYQYKDSILSLLDENTVNYRIVKSAQYLMDRDFTKALELAESAFNEATDEHTQAICAYVLSDIHSQMGNRDKEKEYLIISSISDIKSAVKEYISLRKLGILLYEEGDIDRAYTYMKLSLEDAISSNARVRTLEISEMLPLVSKTYDLKMKAENKRLVTALIIISVLSVVLIISIYSVYIQLKKLAKARRNLKEINNNLKRLNLELSESNYIKEEYISYVFVMCSEYIDKLEDFRKMVNRKVKTGQIDDLHKITSSSSLVADELKSFYKSFDTIFLNLYPNFIDDFNSLLLKEERITPKESELLSPEMRIFALVRLGINDSIKIANFLHYSSQTVYNYRLKVRNKAISKDDFNDAVTKIGK